MLCTFASATLCAEVQLDDQSCSLLYIDSSTQTTKQAVSVASRLLWRAAGGNDSTVSGVMSQLAHAAAAATATAALAEQYVQRTAHRVAQAQGRRTAAALKVSTVSYY
jgi:hypothetical protein